MQAAELFQGPWHGPFALRGMAVLKSCIGALGWLSGRHGVAVTPDTLAEAIDLQSMGDLAFDGRFRRLNLTTGTVEYIDAQDMPEGLLAPLREYLCGLGYDTDVHHGAGSRRCAAQLHACCTTEILLVLHDLASSGDARHAG